MLRAIPILFALILSAFAAPPLHAEPPEKNPPLTLLRTEVTAATRTLQSSALLPTAAPAVRDLTAAAYYTLALGQSPPLAQQLLQKAFDQQNMDPASPDFGDVPWQIGHPEIKDANAIEFTINPLGPLFLLHADPLSPDFKAAALPHLKAAVEAIRRHKVNPGYTNIYLMKAANLHLLGLILHDQPLADEGATLLRDWFAFTRTHGIPEFESPTYFSTQLTCLLQAYRCTTDPTLKPQLKAALDFLWTDLAANTFLQKAGGAQLAGPFSRTYDFAAGSGPLDRYLFAEGLRTAPPTRTLFVDLAGPLMNDLEHGYHPSADILALAHLPSRLIHQRTGILPGQDRTCFLTPDFAIGSTSAYHGPQDRQLSISLAATDDHPMADLSVILDPFDSPYGTHELKDRSGHSKPTHLRNDLAAVQSNGTILALLHLNPNLANQPESTLATNILFPANADQLLLDGNPLSLTPGQVVPVSSKTWLMVRQGKAVAAVRIFLADLSAEQQPESAELPRWYIKYDGTKANAARLVAYHYQGEEKLLTDKTLRAGIMMMVRSCDSPEAVQAWADELRKISLHQTLEDHQWTVETGNLKATLDLAKRIVVSRTVDGKEMVTGTFTLNGIDESKLLP
jgi:hypothetical protein